MKYDFAIKEISKQTALKMVQKYHYSNTLPKINKHFLGFYLENELVGVITLGWGTRPLHTIKRIFPSLSTEYGNHFNYNSLYHCYSSVSGNTTVGKIL